MEGMKNSLNVMRHKWDLSGKDGSGRGSPERSTKSSKYESKVP
jgi:hypothetical protein